MKRHYKLAIAIALPTLVVAALIALGVRAANDKKAAPASPAPIPALSVTTTQPQATRLPLRIAANGNIMAWQEASIGAEANGLRLAEVRVNVGDVVKRGQVLAAFAPETVQSRSGADARAASPRPRRRSPRRRRMRSARASCRPPARSVAQQIQQYMTAERTAQARLEWQRSAAKTQQLRLSQTQRAGARRRRDLVAQRDRRRGGAGRDRNCSA